MYTSDYADRERERERERDHFMSRYSTKKGMTFLLNLSFSIFFFSIEFVSFLLGVSFFLLFVFAF